MSEFADDTFDVVLCHNVLEYVSDKEIIVQELSRVIKNGGIFSIVKHNLRGKVMSCAVFSDNPRVGLELLENGDGGNNMFGRRDTYDDEYVVELGCTCGLELKNIFGIRTFFALSQNNDVKFSQE